MITVDCCWAISTVAAAAVAAAEALFGSVNSDAAVAAPETPGVVDALQRSQT